MTNKSNFMDLFLLRSVKNTIKYWYVPLVVGIVFVLVSILAFVSPTTSLMTLTTLFSLSFLFGGLTEILFSIENRKNLYNWGWSFAFGVITFVVGILLFSMPKVTLMSLALYVGCLVLFRSFAAISFAINIKRYGSQGWGKILVFGILGAVLAIFLLWNPIVVGVGVVLLIAFNILFAGVFCIYFSFELKKIAMALSPERKENFIDLNQKCRCR